MLVFTNEGLVNIQPKNEINQNRIKSVKGKNHFSNADNDEVCQLTAHTTPEGVILYRFMVIESAYKSNRDLGYNKIKHYSIAKAVKYALSNNEIIMVDGKEMKGLPATPTLVIV